MTSQIQDTIERKLTVQAPMERVYRAFLSDFLRKKESDLTPGTHTVLEFECGKTSIHVIAAEPFTYFAYRWVPGGTFEGDIYAHGSTLVEFRLAEAEGGTSMTVVESGFASLPPERYKESIENNTEGWDEELGKLVKSLEA